MPVDGNHRLQAAKLRQSRRWRFFIWRLRWKHKLAKRSLSAEVFELSDEFQRPVDEERVKFWKNWRP